jgi:hypothetical protein
MSVNIGYAGGLWRSGRSKVADASSAEMLRIQERILDAVLV